MDNSEKLKLEDVNAWQDAYIEAFQDKDPISSLNETLGSVTGNKTIFVDINEKCVDICHDGNSIDNDDMKRLTSISGTKKNNSRKKGDSVRGAGLRCEMAIHSPKSKLDLENYKNYSFFISTASEDINHITKERTNLNFKKGESIIYFITGEFEFTIKKGIDFPEIIKTCGRYKNAFHLPIDNYPEWNKVDVKYALRRIFNRSDCKIILNNVNITEKKKYMLMDIKLPFKYLEVKVEVYKIKKNGKSIIKLIRGDDIMYLDLGKKSGRVLIKENIDTWAKGANIDEKDISDKEYSCKLRFQGFIKNNTPEYKEYCKYYYGKENLDGEERNGMLPYKRDKCLRDTWPSYKNPGSKVWDYMPGIASDRGHTRDWRRGNRKYKVGQQWTVELQEDQDSETTIIKQSMKKIDSKIFSSSEASAQYLKQLPYIADAIIKEHIWEYEECDHIREPLSTDEHIKNLEERAEKAEHKAKEEKKKALEAEHKAKEEKKKALEAEHKARKEKKKALEAEQKARDEEEKKIEVEIEKEELERKNDESEKELKAAHEIIAELDIDTTESTGFHIYLGKDPTRPYMRKSGLSTKGTDDLLKQYGPRFMPKGFKILHWVDFKSKSEMKSAESFLQDSLFKKYIIPSPNETDRNTEWVEFPDSWTQKRIDDFCINKINGMIAMINED